MHTHTHDHTHEHEHGGHTLMIIRIAAAAVMLAVLMIFKVDNALIHALLFIVPLAVIGYDVFWRAITNILHGEVFDENFLMCAAAAGAMAIGEQPEAVAVMLFFQIGELFQDIAVERSRRSVSELMNIRPDHADVERNGETIRAEPSSVAVGEITVISPGARIPLDGVIVSGGSSVDTSALTGEAMPRDVGEGDEVISGCVNLTGVLRVRVSKTYESSTAARILELVEQSSERKAPAESFIRRFARYYTPIVCGAAVLLAIIPPLAFGGDWSEWIRRALLFLVVSCPCALVVSVPLGFFAGIGCASRRGILIKGGNCLDTLARIDTAVFDKTGTLTSGEFTVTAIQPVSLSERELAETAALAEFYSPHPIAASLRAYCKELDSSRVCDVSEKAGLGVTATVDGHSVAVGNERLMIEFCGECDTTPAPGTTVHIARDGVYLGRIVIGDTLKNGAVEAIAALKTAGVRRTVMLTGDNAESAAAVASALGIDEFRSRLMPADKVDAVEELLSEKNNGSLIFTGDGVNDAPVLARADLGIAMGALGSDAAIEAADVVLMNDSIADIPTAVRIAKRTRRIVVQNIILALAVKLGVMLLGAVGLISMWGAVFADVGVLILAVANATRALRLPK